MKKILVLMLIAISIASCGGKQTKQKEVNNQVTPKDGIEVLYFYGKQRCITCNAIENLTKEVVNKDFAQHLKDNKVVFKMIDISTKEGEKIADKYEITWSSLFINKWKGGKETKHNMTDFGFLYAKDSPEVFRAGVKKKIRELLN